MTHTIETDLPAELNQEVVIRVFKLLQGVRFGSLEIVVHDGRIVQIDKHEKFRLKGHTDNR
ncbi:YezD family protein [Methylicorpusculum oleiharenae]|uniref:YezD family protein n=1 Tax=Methylicorpusculum oleiharenae TaxID=1338687 RepID=UPI001357578E|nr:YezD family protein [Methylicorpusculum oleiharenae]MCD2450463.1 YezD family protein [Methylicorpusculum oleiharenae]